MVQFEFLLGVIPSGAVLQAERGISRIVNVNHARSLGPLVKTRPVGMTTWKRISDFKLHRYRFIFNA
jgi:hypothetical protein